MYDNLTLLSVKVNIPEEESTCGLTQNIVWNNISKFPRDTPYILQDGIPLLRTETCLFKSHAKAIDGFNLCAYLSGTDNNAAPRTHWFGPLRETWI